MRRLVHLSDLHFGRDMPGLEAPLLDAIGGLRPDLVVISGDFTQRARRSQFAAARAFLDRIEAPVLAVPGNHDTPLDNLYLRVFKPFSRYRRAIARDLEPVWEDDEVAVVGVNTVNRFAWQRGRFSNRTARRVCRIFDDAHEKVQIAVLHHPLEHGPEVDKRLMTGARQALAALAGCGTDVVLSGHLHVTSAAPFTAAPGLLFVQAGTGLSTRRREEPNTFNLLDIDWGQIAVTSFAARQDGAGTDFVPARTARYVRGAMGWERSEGDPGPGPHEVVDFPRSTGRG